MDFVARMDPRLAQVLPSIPLLDLRDIPTARAERRELAERARAAWSAPEAVTRTDHLAPGEGGAPPVRVRVYAPRDVAGPVPCLYWAHGGGHVLGDVDQDDPLLSAVVEDTGAVCASVDWRRAPEHPFPAPLDDCYAGLRWVTEHAGGLGVDPTRIVVGGASSGGGLAAGLALLARDRGELHLDQQLLVYPMLDDREVTASSRAITHPHVWNRDSNRIAWRAYLGGAQGADVSPYAAPARASDLTGLPPAWIATAELDLFVDEDIDYAQRLIAAGVPTELHVYRGAVHGFDLFAPDAEVSRRYLADRTAALRRALRPDARAAG
ncbi:alpha/beta hydrolase [Geodermatophilus sp. TF02-6]|uniref:alpha/beta hydrolase n=1 Tax=Geodermatophilus sp. TF02-6 TaxID=2250575 RepID=UPI000DEA882C|nr:alpha/beta hydrolase [Geodermatophilus sp. TF02-6]RBY83666.1 alpha/beta hydrolase [Geodermatophilus sp. TF02-6]